MNVPNPHNNFHVPPPLPPRREKQSNENRDNRSAQSQQAPDAPELPPRDLSPPPVPPRLSLTHIAIKKSSKLSQFNSIFKIAINMIGEIVLIFNLISL